MTYTLNSSHSPNCIVEGQAHLAVSASDRRYSVGHANGVRRGSHGRLVTHGLGCTGNSMRERSSGGSGRVRYSSFPVYSRQLLERLKRQSRPHNCQVSLVGRLYKRAYDVTYMVQKCNLPCWRALAFHVCECVCDPISPSDENESLIQHI